MIDTPESVREMIEESEAVGAPFYLVGLNEMLTRYATVLETESARIRELEAALLECDRQATQCRVWGGMKWVYHPIQAEAIRRKVNEVMCKKEFQP